jgi:hypothetical protein
MNSTLLILLITLIIYVMLTTGMIENIGSGYWHQGKLTDIRSNIQSHLKKYTESKKEDFENEEDGIFEPNKYVISEYSKNSVMEPSSVRIGELEKPELIAPADYTNLKDMADFLEVDKYNAGSGDLSNLNDAYKQLNKEQYFATLKALAFRGGNVSVV